MSDDCEMCGRMVYSNPGRWALLFLACTALAVLDMIVGHPDWQNIWGVAFVLVLVVHFGEDWLGRKSIDQ